MDQLTEFEQVAIELARKAGQMIVNAVNTDHMSVSSKANWRDLVTEHDRAIEKFIFDQLRTRYPSHKLIGEESNSASQTTPDANRIDADRPTWVVDPIDGTINFVHHYPLCCVSIGLAVGGQLVLGVIYVPFLDKMYSARKGHGARCNDAPMHVSTTTGDTLERALVMNEFIVNPARVDQSHDYLRKVFDRIQWRARSVRSIGSACVAMCFVAEGVADAYWHTNLCVWDVAAAFVIVTEAGGTVFTIDGHTFDPHHGTVVAATTEKLAQQIAEVTAFSPD